MAKRLILGSDEEDIRPSIRSYSDDIHTESIIELDDDNNEPLPGTSSGTSENDFPFNANTSKYTPALDESRILKSFEIEETRLTEEANVLQKQMINSMALFADILNQFMNSTVVLQNVISQNYNDKKMPILTDAMLIEVNKALNAEPIFEVLVSDFDLIISRNDILTLTEEKQPNENIINFYMKLVVKRGGTNNYPSVLAMSTEFYQYLDLSEYKSALETVGNINIFSKQLIIVPVLDNVDWSVAIIDFRDKSIRYYNSLGKPNPDCLRMLQEYLRAEMEHETDEVLTLNGWTIENVDGIPHQSTANDSGVFACIYAEYISANKQLLFSQDDIPYFRKKMIYEILHSELL